MTTTIVSYGSVRVYFRHKAWSVSNDVAFHMRSKFPGVDVPEDLHARDIHLRRARFLFHNWTNIMDSPNPTSNEPSGASTPNSRFTSQAITAEDTLKSQTVGLVTLADFRKRRAEALEQQELEASRAATPVSESSAPADK